jgi:phosphatidylserine decarboxylase
MNNYPHPIIAREGWLFLVIIFIVAVISNLFLPAIFSFLAGVIFLFVLQFFRDPPRLVPQGEGLILSPADGRIVAIEKTFDLYAQRDAIKISVFMNVFNVHSNRIPINAMIKNIQYFPGKFLNADLDKASLENERNAMILTVGARQSVITCVQVAGLIARRILCYVQPNDQVKAGQRYGFIRFGSRVDVYLPLDAQVKVALGEKVSATETILAQLIDDEVSPDL